MVRGGGGGGGDPFGWEMGPAREKRHRLMCGVLIGPDYQIFALTLALVFLPSVFFFAFPCVQLMRQFGFTPVVMIVGIVLCISSLSFAIKAHTTDPGIIPRNAKKKRPATGDDDDDNQSQDEGRASTLTPIAANGGNDPPQTREMIVNSVAVVLKYCTTCKLYRPPRASHCSVCDCCIENFDHHCPWIGNCVGKRNYRWFVCFLVATSSLIFWIFAFSLTLLILTGQRARAEGDDTAGQFTAALAQCYVSAILLVVCVFVIFSVPGLCCMHLSFIASGQTTNESIKGTYSGSNNRNNAYSHSSALKNYKMVFWSEPHHHSHLNV